MTQVTDRLTNQNIVELAKKQYESQKRAKVPGYLVKLPSGGKIYSATSPLRSGTVENMTGLTILTFDSNRIVVVEKGNGKEVNAICCG